ncbi:MAG: hypothetical protein JJU27_14010 [Gammaproteobacteria bacterium]|nr:hypothetical protein [Gammaproteobacteria bacterium]
MFNEPPRTPHRQSWRDKLLLDEAEAADVLGVAPLTLKAARLRKLRPGHPLASLPHVRIGKAPKYRPGDLEAFVDAHLVERDR